MATSLITVKDVQEKSKDGSTWLEITDQENRTHRIFRRVQDNEGNWHDLSGKYDMLRNSENRQLRLTTEKKGIYTNVVDVEAAEPAPMPRSQERKPVEERKSADEMEAECRLKTFTTAYAKDLAVAGKISMDNILGWSEIFYRYLQGEITISDDDLNDIMQKAKAGEETASARAPRRATTSKTLEGITR
jgi:hypothetical protein